MTWKHFKNNAFKIQYLPSSHPGCTSPASPHGLMALCFCSDLDLSQYFWPLLYHLVQVPYRALLISSPKEFSISPFPPTPPILPWFKRWSTLSWSTKETFWLSSLQFPHQQKGEKNHNMRAVSCFVWGQNENCSLGNSISERSEKLFQTAPKR